MPFRAARGEVAAEALLGALPDPLALVDRSGVAGFANAAFRAALDPASPWRPGRPAAEALPDAAAALAAALSGSAAAPVPIGRLVVHVAPLDGLGALLRLVPKAAPEAPRFELIGRLAGGIAHDFNNLLAVMLGAVGAARVASAPDGVAEEFATIEAACERGAGLVRQLLAFARQQVLAPRVIVLDDAVASLAQLLPRLLGDGIRLELGLEGAGRQVRVDPSQLDQVLLNLAVNARDAMGGRGVLRMTTGRRLVLREEDGLAPGRYVVLEVADDGPGIAPEVAARLFEPFFTTKLESGGTGLGLATVQGIVVQSGGRIEVETAPGQGTRFRILLPRHDSGEASLPQAADRAGPDAAMEPGVPRPGVPAPGEPTNVAGPVLLVEDEPALMRLGRFALGRAGHEAVGAEDGSAALELIEGGLRPAVLVTDVAMPGLDGLELARAARRALPDLPVVLLSGYSAGAVGADLAAERLHFLPKPFTPEALCDVVSRALAAR